MTTQFAKYTLDEALILYQRGYLTTCGLVEMFFRITLKDDANWSRSYTAKELSGILGIAERTIYKAISKCRIDGYLFFCAEGKIKFARNESALESANYTTDSTAPNYQNTETIDESKALHNRTHNCTIRHFSEQSYSQDEQSCSQTEQSCTQDEQSCTQTAQSCKTTGLKPSSEGQWGDAPNSIQIYFKSFSNLLQARGVDFEKQKKSFVITVSELAVGLEFFFCKCGNL